MVAGIKTVVSRDFLSFRSLHYWKWFSRLPGTPSILRRKWISSSKIPRGSPKCVGLERPEACRDFPWEFPFPRLGEILFLVFLFLGGCGGVCCRVECGCKYVVCYMWWSRVATWISPRAGHRGFAWLNSCKLEASGVSPRPSDFFWQHTYRSNYSSQSYVLATYNTSVPTKSRAEYSHTQIYIYNINIQYYTCMYLHAHTHIYLWI